jgi:hypothetical protein
MSLGDFGSSMTNGGDDGIFGDFSGDTIDLSGANTYAGGANLFAGFPGGTQLGANPDGTQGGGSTGGVSPGSALDTLANTALNVAAQTVPIWTASLLGQQSQNQNLAPTYAGNGVQPGLTSGSGPYLPGPQPPGGTATATTSYTPLLIVGAIIIGIVLLLKK